MNKIALLALILILSSCGFKKQDVDFHDTIEPDIEILESSPVNGGDRPHFGILIYEPKDVQEAMTCDFEVTQYSIEPYEIKKQIITGVYKQIELQTTQKVDNSLLNKLNVSDYVLIKDNLVVTASGDTLDFIDWAIISIKGDEIMWSDHITFYEQRFNYNGDLNMKDYLDDDSITIDLTARGKSPSMNTWIGAYIDLYLLSDCE